MTRFATVPATLDEEVLCVPDPRIENPAVQRLARFITAQGLAAIQFSGNTFDGYYLPEGIILRSDL